MTDRSSNKLSAFVLALFTLVALVVPLLGKAEAGHLTRVCLDVDHTDPGDGSDHDPESMDNFLGETHEVTAILRSQIGAPAPDDACNGDEVPAPAGGVNIDFRIEGAHDPNPENTSGTADFSCDIPAGESTCTAPAGGYTGDTLGTDLIRGWVDHDNIQSTVEADSAEGPQDTAEPGTGDFCNRLEPDCTDVVEKNWVAGSAAKVDCDDPGPPDTEREYNPSNEGSASNETYTCTVTDTHGNPVGSGESVHGEVENDVNDPDGTDGPSHGSPDYGCTTGSNSTCTITVTQNEGEPGTAEICFWIDRNNEGPGTSGSRYCANEATGEGQVADGSDPPNDEADQVEKTWETRRASAIDAEPESDTNTPGENHTISATVYDQFGSTFRGNTKIDFEFFQGSPSDADGNTPETPDKSCSTVDSSSCSITYTSQQSGLDLVCVYPDASRPSMNGGNFDGSCDGETLNDEDDDPRNPDAPTRDDQGRVSDDQDVVQKRWAAPGEATRLDCTPETASNPTGTSHTVTCTARNQQNNVVGGVNVDAEATGANDPDANSDSSSPDFSCVTNDNGVCSFTHGTGGRGTTTEQGTTTYRAWIDSDNNNATAEGDPSESQDETTSAGAGRDSEPDNTDVVQKTWTGDARRIDCEPETANNATGTTHTVTCTVTDRTGSPVAGEGVEFTETGSGDIQGSNTDTSDENGQASVTTTSNENGEQTITGTLADDTNTAEPDEVDECDRAVNDPQGAPAGECSDSVTKTWGPPQPECSDGVDNDNDGSTDYPDDPECSSAQDTSEAGTGAQCSDGIDNDNDGNTDFPDDTGCSSEADQSETGETLTNGPCAGYAQSSSTPRQGGGRVIVGTNGPDDLRGSGGNDLICALGGRDTVRGAGGNDTIYGGGGHDDIRGNAGNDTLYGQAGLDVMRGGHGSDEIRGGGQDDTMRGYTGNDRMWGGGGNDTLRAGDGRDRLRGNKGDDLLDGGGGRDNCRGGPGSDRSFRCER